MAIFIHKLCPPERADFTPCLPKEETDSRHFQQYVSFGRRSTLLKSLRGGTCAKKFPGLPFSAAALMSQVACQESEAEFQKSIDRSQGPNIQLAQGFLSATGRRDRLAVAPNNSSWSHLGRTSGHLVRVRVRVWFSSILGGAIGGWFISVHLAFFHNHTRTIFFGVWMVTTAPPLPIMPPTSHQPQPRDLHWPCPCQPPAAVHAARAVGALQRARPLLPPQGILTL